MRFHKEHLRVGQIAPDFNGITKDGEPLDFYHWTYGSWGFLFSFSSRRTPVCATEVANIEAQIGAFRERNVRPIGVAIETPEELEHGCRHIHSFFDDLHFPLVVDRDREIAASYEMLHHETMLTLTHRRTVITDPNRVVRAILDYPFEVGRSVDELLRVIDGLQTADRHGVVIPADWAKGEQVLLPSGYTDAEAERLHPGRWRKLGECFRVLEIE